MHFNDQVLTEARQYDPSDQGFVYGVYEVKITGVTHDTSNAEKEFLTFDVIGAEGQKDKVRMYLSERASEITLKTVKALLVHQQTDDVKKQDARDRFNEVVDSQGLFAQALTLVNGSAWLKVSRGGEFTRQDGSIGHYKQRNLYAYQPNADESAVQQPSESGMAEFYNDGANPPF
jgi:hypothetical protein